MPDNSKGALDLLEDLRKERDELNALIRGLEKRLGIVSGGEESETLSSIATVSQANFKAIPLGFFHNMTQADAAEKLLRMNPGNPLSTHDILAAFRKSGMPVNSKNAVQILYTTLKRSSRFERVASKAWGLSEWYDKKRKREDEQETQ